MNLFAYNFFRYCLERFCLLTYHRPEKSNKRRKMIEFGICFRGETRYQSGTICDIILESQGCKSPQTFIFKQDATSPLTVGRLSWTTPEIDRKSACFCLRRKKTISSSFTNSSSVKISLKQAEKVKLFVEVHFSGGNTCKIPVPLNQRLIALKKGVKYDICLENNCLGDLKAQIAFFSESTSNECSEPC